MTRPHHGVEPGQSWLHSVDVCPVDRTQDSEGVMDQVLDLLQQNRANTEAAVV